MMRSAVSGENFSSTISRNSVNTMPFMAGSSRGASRYFFAAQAARMRCTVSPFVRLLAFHRCDLFLVADRRPWSRPGGLLGSGAKETLNRPEQARQVDRLGVVAVAAGLERLLAVARHGMGRE